MLVKFGPCLLENRLDDPDRIYAYSKRNLAFSTFVYR